MYNYTIWLIHHFPEAEVLWSLMRDEAITECQPEITVNYITLHFSIFVKVKVRKKEKEMSKYVHMYLLVDIYHN